LEDAWQAARVAHAADEEREIFSKKYGEIFKKYGEMHAKFGDMFKKYTDRVSNAFYNSLAASSDFATKERELMTTIKSEIEDHEWKFDCMFLSVRQISMLIRYDLNQKWIFF
jgi:hypothetical protein